MAIDFSKGASGQVDVAEPEVKNEIEIIFRLCFLLS